ncbi:hypothetical protein Daus18300_010127 [Diaporthe australafricana]|uniref:C2H2-type domain-containing protein n=1 Tax=Diaporthe australafricana TaxID=127596 RepID=A0ABR3WC28_9PEZI
MASYQHPRNPSLGHVSEDNAATQSAGPSHPTSTYHVNGVNDSTLAHLPINQISQGPEAWAYTGTEFVRLSTLNRHIAAQAGPKHHCKYCDDNRAFAREDKLVDHLRAVHKFGANAVAEIRAQGRHQPQESGRTHPTVTTVDFAVPMSTPAGHSDAPDGAPAGQTGSNAGLSAGVGLTSFPMFQADFIAGPSSGLAWVPQGDLTNFPKLNAAGIQSFSAAEDYP